MIEENLNQSTQNRISFLEEEVARLQAQLSRPERCADILQLRQKTIRLQALVQLSQLLAEVNRDYAKVLDIIVRHISEVIGGGCAISLLAQDGQHLKVAAIYHPDPTIVQAYLEMLQQAPLQASEGTISQVFKTGQPLLQPVLSLEEVLATIKPQFQAEASQFRIYSRIIVPLKAQGRTIGVLALSRYQPDEPYTLEDQLFLQNLADRAAIAIASTKLYSSLEKELAERKRVEGVLRAYKDRLRRITENMLDIIFQTDNEGRCEYVSPSCEASLGYKAEELVGQSLLDFILPEDKVKVVSQVSPTWQTLEATRVEFRALHKSGHYLWLELTGKPLLTKNGKLEGAIFTGRDITTRKEAEEALKNSQQQLLQAQKMETIGRLAGGIAHDFNNLLTIILTSSELLLDCPPEKSPTIRAGIEQIKEASLRAASLTRQLLAFSRQQILQPKLVNLNQVVADMDKLLHRLIGEDVQLQTVLEPKLARVKIDPGQFEQVIMNLALNARDAMSGSGILTIETANVFLEENYTPAQFQVKTGEYIMLAVSDNGIGMDSATQARIFEPFFTTKEPGRGTGLGLATLYGIVKQSEGYIWVYSTPDVGTTFKIYLPKNNESQEPNKSSEEPGSFLKTAALHGGETILVVEDEEAVRKLLRQAFESYGYKVLTARHGLEALALLKQYNKKVDLVLSDLIMPQMGGVELVKAVREKHPKVKLVVMSGYTDRVAIQQGVVALCDRYVQKPFSPRELLVSIREVLDSRGVEKL